MHVGIYTIKDTLFLGEASKIIARTTTGEITVLPNHIPLVSTLTASTVRVFDKEGKEKKIVITSGVIEIRPESKVVILATA